MKEPGGGEAAYASATPRPSFISTSSLLLRLLRAIMGVSTLQHLVKFGTTSIGILSVGYAGSTKDLSDTRDERGDTSLVLRVLIGICSSTGVLEYFRAVE
jgi:hypothetical protein